MMDNRRRTDVGDPDEDAKDDDASGPPRWAADEPTAMWDESAMRVEGYDDLAADRAAKPRAQTGPATAREVRGEDREAVKVSGGVPRTGAAPGGRRTPGLVVTLIVAIALGIAVFFLVRLLR